MSTLIGTRRARLVARLVFSVLLLVGVTLGGSILVAGASAAPPAIAGASHGNSAAQSDNPYFVGMPSKAQLSKDFAEHPNVTIGNTACGSMSVSPSTAVYGGQPITVNMNWTANTGTANCQMIGNNCPTGFGDCNTGYWLVGVFCSTLAANDIAGAEGDCDLNNIIVFTDNKAGPDNNTSGTSWNVCNTVNDLGNFFGGLPGTLQCIADGGGSDGWVDHWPIGSTSGSATGYMEETGSGTGFNPTTSGVDCPPTQANINAGAIANTCAFILMPASFQYVCGFDACIPDVGDTDDGVTLQTSDYLATLFQYQYAASFTSAASTSVEAGDPLNYQILTNASPTATVTVNGTLPSGVRFVQESGGDAEFVGTPSVSSAGTYNVTLTASNGVSPNATQSFTLTVSPRPPNPVISSFSPSSGPTAGGTTVTIAGNNFTGTTAVDFGASAAKSFDVVSNTELTAVTPAGSGSVILAVTNAGGITDATNDYTYVLPPTIASSGVAPTSGPTAGGQLVTITGTNLLGTTAVHFGTGSATLESVGSTQVTALTPGGSAGSVSVSVTTPGGTATAITQYSYVAPPSITAVLPDVGPVAGGTPVEITGNNLGGTTSVTFGGVAATDVTPVTGNEVTCDAPAGTGSVSVVLTTAGGSTTALPPYTYYAIPADLTVSPDTGSTGGGSTVTIDGTNLTGTTSVAFGGVAATDVTVDDSGQVTAESPPGTGSVSISLSTPGGTAFATPQFTYVPGPSLSGTSPDDGPEAGGTAVTVSGSDIAGATAVYFGSSAATFTDVTSTSLVAYAPAGTGTVDVTVDTPGGSAVSTTQYTYLPAATVTGITPASGPTAGGTTVTVSGSGLTGASSVSFGAAEGTGLTVVNDSTITVTAPAGSGTVDVIVVTPGGAVVSPVQFSYVVAPTITAISPVTGPATGGTTVVITGTGLSGTSSVEFGSTNASFGFVTATSVSTSAPAGTGSVEVTVTTPGGTATAPALYSYIPLPTITSIAPDYGPKSAGTEVTITGTGLGSASGVDFGSSAGELLSAGSTTVTALAPAGSGTVDVTVQTPDGPVVSPQQFVYIAAPAVTALSPATGAPAGGTSVTITGTNLAGATEVYFGSKLAKFSSNTGTTIVATAPKGTAAAVNVRVRTPGGLSPVSKGDRFTYVKPPKVVAITPTSGSPSGGLVVTLVGSDLCHVTAVHFGSATGTRASANSNCTVLTIDTPRSPGGLLAADTVSVSVSTPSGTVPSPISFTFTRPGYWLVGSNGSVYSFGGARSYGSMGGRHLSAPIVAMADTPDRRGYWLFGADGAVYAFGDAKYYGSVPQVLGPHRHLAAPIVTVEVTPDGRGYRMFAADGGVFDFGDAHYVGSLPGLHIHPNGPIVAATSNPIGQGYWLVGADGGVYTFPDAVFLGSLGAAHVKTPIVWMSSTATGSGYWIFGADGKVWSFGSARTFPDPPLSTTIVAGVTTTDGGGYWLVGRNGAIYGFGDAADLGSVPAMHLHVDDIVGGVGF